MLFVSAYIVEIHSPSRQLMRATAVDIAVVNRTDSGARRTIISFACASVTYVPFICVSVMYLPFICVSVMYLPFICVSVMYVPFQPSSSSSSFSS